MRCDRRDGPHLFTTRGCGDNLDAIRMSALDQARAFYGAQAMLVVEHVGTVSPALGRAPGRFSAAVEICCVNFGFDVQQDASGLFIDIQREGPVT
jgi:hypothetical protein